MADLSNVKLGDWLAVWSYHNRLPKKCQVTKTTATRITVNGRQFMRATGREVYAGSYKASAAPWTHEHDKQIADATLLAEQKARLAEAFKTFDGTVNDLHQLNYISQPVDPAKLDAVEAGLRHLAALAREVLQRAKDA